MSIISETRKFLLPIIKNFKALEPILSNLNKKFPDNYFFSSLVPPNNYYTEKDIRNCNRNGINFELKINDYQQWLLYFNIEQDSSLGILRFVKEGDIVFDVGGNIGQTSLSISKIIGYKGKIYSFEPFPTTLQSFKKNLKLNEEVKNIELVECGLGAEENTLFMYKDCLTNSGANRIFQNQTATNDLTKVSISTLDNFVNSSQIDKINLIKIDVEGYEMKVLLGGKEVIKKLKPNLYIEVDSENLNKQGNSIKEMILFLQQNNYKIYNPKNMKEITSENDISPKVRDIFCC